MLWIQLNICGGGITIIDSLTSSVILIKVNFPHGYTIFKLFPKIISVYVTCDPGSNWNHFVTEDQGKFLTFKETELWTVRGSVE